MSIQDYLYGYRGKAREMLEKAGARVGDIVEVISGNRRYTGILMPRYEMADDKHITIKLQSGYNIGIFIREKTAVRVLSKREEVSKKVEKYSTFEGLPILTLIGTGGTIMSRIDYETGAVKPSFSVNDLLEIVPELKGKYNIEMLELFKIFSEDMTPQLWEEITLKVAEVIKKGSEGVIIAHGTDTMGYTSAALSFALQDLPVPVVLVGAQRSADRPSSDATINLRGAVKWATEGPYSGVFIVMHGGMGDDVCFVHRGTKVRKLHTSRRDAFKSVNARIVAEITNGKIRLIDTSYLKPRDKNRELKVYPKFESKVALIKTYPGMANDLINHLIDEGYKGIVIEGTGLGHVPLGLVKSIKEAVSMGIVVVIASQCIWGRVNMNVYSRGRELIRAGAIGAEDMLPETALVKLMWLLGQGFDPETVKSLMQINLVGEINERTLP